MVLKDWGCVDEFFKRYTAPAEVPTTTPAPGTEDAVDSTYPGY